MLYTIVEPFSLADGDSWNSYCKWRGIQFEAFDSIDSILRPSLFTPNTKEDCKFIVTEYHMEIYLNNFDYACLKQKQIKEKSILLGVDYDIHDESNLGFIGYDLIDGYYSNSLLTNWGNDTEIINQNVSLRGLVNNYEVVKEIQEYLLKFCGNDDHVEYCSSASIYSTEHRRNNK